MTPFEKGFIKRAMEYGLTEKQANLMAGQLTGDIPLSAEGIPIPSSVGAGIGGAMLGAGEGAGAGMLGGGLLGGLMGSLSGRKEDKANNVEGTKLRNALIGALLGGGAGGMIGAPAGAGIEGSNYAAQELYKQDALKKVLSNLN